MSTLAALIEPRLAALPRRLALQWPGGALCTGGAVVRLRFRKPQLLGITLSRNQHAHLNGLSTNAACAVTPPCVGNNPTTPSRAGT